MPCLIIAEINQHLLKIHPASILFNHINSLHLDGIAPFFAEKTDKDRLNQLQSATGLTLWLPQTDHNRLRAGEQRYFPATDVANLRFLQQGNGKIWQNITQLEPEKHEVKSSLRGHLTDKCNQNVAIMAPLAIAPVLIALRSIQRFDPYLCEHYLKQFEPTLAALDPVLAEEILTLKLSEAPGFALAEKKMTPSPAASIYFRLERKLHRQYKEHG